MDPASGLQQQEAPHGAEQPEDAAAQAEKATAANKTQERQMQVNRLTTAYREETKQLMKELLKQQISWREELQTAGAHVGLPSFQPPRGLTVRKRLSWRTAEREALKRLLFAHGVGKWKEIHTCLCALLPGFKHGAGDVEDACWQLLGELQLVLGSPEERYYLARLMDPVADRLPIYTPGPSYKFPAVSGAFVRRLQLLEDFNMLMPAMQRSDAVAGYFRTLAAALPEGQAPASWWGVEADVGLLAGLYKHGYNNFDEVRRDPELAYAFQGYHARQDAAQPPQADVEGHPAADADPPADGAQSTGKAAAGATSAKAADDDWPSEEVLGQRVRQLFTLLAQAVVLAESQGLLMPLPGEGLALSERLLQLPPSAGYVAAGATLIDNSLFLEDEDGPLEELLCGYEDSGDESSSEEEAAYAAPYGRGRGRRGRGRGRGRGRRTSKAERLAAEAAAFGAMVSTAQADEDDGDDGGGRRRHRPNSRYADHVLLPVAPATHGLHDSHASAAPAPAAAATASHQHEVSWRDLSKKQKKDLLALLFVWGPPEAAAGRSSEDGDAEAAGATAAGAQAEYDWEGWLGRQEFNAALKQASDKALTAMLKELTGEMDGLISSGAKPRNTHAPTCDCVVCINRRRADERRQREMAEADQGGAEGGEGPGSPKAEAGVGVGGGDDTKQQFKAETLTAVTASRLQERLDLLSTFRAAVDQLPAGWHLQTKTTAAAKELPPWWKHSHDLGLVQGVLQHGYGNWVAMCEDEKLPFKASAVAAGVDVDALTAAAAAPAAGSKGSKAAKASAVQPEWVPDSKALQKRCKSLVTSLKRLLTRNSAVQGASHKAPAAAAAAGGQAAAAGGAAAAAAAGLQGRAVMQLPMAQQQQLLSLPPNPVAAGAIAQLAQRLGPGPALLQALQSAAAQGNPALLTEYLRQQALQQQQQASTVLGKRGAAAAGLPEGGSGARAAPGARTQGAAAAAGAGAGGGGRISESGSGAAGGGAGALTPEAALALVRSMPLVQRNAAGAAVLPLVLSKDLMIIALGRVQPTEAFQSSSQIFPVGYTATCTYPSAVTPGAATRYTTTIAEGSGSNSALFVVVAADAPGKQWVATTPAGVWQQIQSEAHTAQQQHNIPVPPADGLAQMGLSHPLVSVLVQELPGAATCQQFKPELSAAPPHLAAAIRQHQAALQHAHQQQAAAAAAAARAPVAAAPATAGLVPAAAAAAGTAAAPVNASAVLQQQVLAAQLLQQQQSQHMVQAGQPIAAAAVPQQQQQQMLQLLQQQRQVMQQQQGLGQAGSVASAGLQQQMLLQQQLMQRMSALQQQQQQQQPQGPQQ